MKTKIPFSESHPLLHAKRQEHLKGYTDAVGLTLAIMVGAPVIAFLGGAFIFYLWGLKA